MLFATLGCRMVGGRVVGVVWVVSFSPAGGVFILLLLLHEGVEYDADVGSRASWCPVGAAEGSERCFESGCVWAGALKVFRSLLTKNVRRDGVDVSTETRHGS